MSNSVRVTLKLIPIIVALGVLIAANRVEHVFMPVVQDFVVTEIDRSVSNQVTLSGYMRKVRDCRFVGVRAEGDAEDDWVQVPLLFLDRNDDHTATRPTGTQAWGPWRITVAAPEAASFLRLTSTHFCHPVWPVDTLLVTVPIRSLH